MYYMYVYCCLIPIIIGTIGNGDIGGNSCPFFIRCATLPKYQLSSIRYRLFQRLMTKL